MEKQVMTSMSAAFMNMSYATGWNTGAQHRAFYPTTNINIGWMGSLMNTANSVAGGYFMTLSANFPSCCPPPQFCQQGLAAFLGVSMDYCPPEPKQPDCAVSQRDEDGSNENKCKPCHDKGRQHELSDCDRSCPDECPKSDKRDKPDRDCKEPERDCRETERDCSKR